MGLKSLWIFRHEPCGSTEPRRSRRWRHIAIVALSPLLCSLSIAQLFLSVLLFTYLDIPQCLVVGQLIALIASIICLGLQAFFWFLTRYFGGTHGLRDRTSYRQNLFMSLHLMFTSIWWISCLNGAYIFGFGKAPKGCPPSAISTNITRVTSPCQVYQVSLSTSVPAFICSFLQLFLFVRCKRPFLSFRAILRNEPAPSPLPVTETAMEPNRETATVRSSIVKEVASLRSNSAANTLPLPPPPSLPSPSHSRPRSWLLPDLEERLSDADQDLHPSEDGSDGTPRRRSEPNHLYDPEQSTRSSHALPPARAVSLYHPIRVKCWSEEGSEASYSTTVSRSQSCASTLVDPASRRSSMKMVASNTSINNSMRSPLPPPPPPALLAETPRFTPIRWSMPGGDASTSHTSDRFGGEGT